MSLIVSSWEVRERKSYKWLITRDPFCTIGRLSVVGIVCESEYIGIVISEVMSPAGHFDRCLGAYMGG